MLNATLHQLGLSLHSQVIDPQTNEIGALPAMLANLCLTNRVVTTDALLTQREATETILAKGGTIACGSKAINLTPWRRSRNGFKLTVVSRSLTQTPST